MKNHIIAKPFYKFLDLIGLTKDYEVNGITIYNFALYPSRKSMNYVKYHEEVHMDQYQKEPFLFLIKYFFYILMFGYDNNPYEVEARVLSGV